ncbi:MAG: hypothetical protein J0H57_05075, partial [Rhodospirillales bacterium]|nr:hypothetical protein [Rhodospirillales bacterium]
SDPAIARALRHDGWHGSRITPEKAGPIVQRLRATRPDPAFTISLRTGCHAGTVDQIGETLAAYREAGIQHVLVAPVDRDLEAYQATIAALARFIA